ncbi:MAG: hypothetical protein WBA93_34510 [Microcoleaceae cyanobacterium]
MLESVQSITQPDIIYPDSDGQPMANNTEQFRCIVVIEQNWNIFKEFEAATN